MDIHFGNQGDTFTNMFLYSFAVRVALVSHQTSAAFAPGTGEQVDTPSASETDSFLSQQAFADEAQQQIEEENGCLYWLPD